MTVNKVDVVIVNFCKKFRLDFKMYISNNELCTSCYLHIGRFSLFLVAFGDI
jgi:hypothetical protein